MTLLTACDTAHCDYSDRALLWANWKRSDMVGHLMDVYRLAKFQAPYGVAAGFHYFFELGESVTISESRCLAT